MSENSNIIDVTETEFNDQVIEASESKLIIVDFWAPWCGPCKQLTPILEKIISKSGDKITLVKINIDENQQIAAQLRIQSIPTVYAFKDKQIVGAGFVINLPGLGGGTKLDKLGVESKYLLEF